jgi:D-lactate dehydrogenase (cytochrome)
MASSKSTLSLQDVPALTYDHSKQNIDGLIKQITESHSIEHTVDTEQCLSKSLTKHSHATATQTPKAIFYPKTTTDVSALLAECHKRHVAVTSFSGGTSLGGALASTRGGVCLDFGGMKEVMELHEDDLDVVVQPGLGWVELNAYLEGRGLFFPVDPAPGARIGGMVSMFLYCATHF